ncbi:ribbon-helix-helix protein, CopG family [Rickettsia endosymbiont of Halotydeus destructor]|uniref:ribbon-helix-helix protein, CopG family n=1 Tax=Rickettsia endosymbiont of Halotydeus destructor TaxID=2996754 RepID=UPI003BAF9B49
MSALTIRLPEKIIEEVNIMAQKLHISRSEYIRKKEKLSSSLQVCELEKKVCV